MMTYLLSNRFTEATPIMKWLQTMRNTFAGQASTQDSIAALQALYEYAKLDTNRVLYNIRVEVTATSMGNSTARIELNAKNWPDLQQVKVILILRPTTSKDTTDLALKRDTDDKRSMARRQYGLVISPLHRTGPPSSPSYPRPRVYRRIHPVWGSVRGTAQGTGIAIMQ
ncbi:hypothetical protein LSH36_224g01021, partial [Paralvinella palmiformis]